MTKGAAFFSILIPNLGYSPYIFECLDSIINQNTNSEFNFEVLFFDQSDFATYGKIKKKISAKYGSNVLVLHSDVRSSYKARISLFNEAHGSYVIYVDSDDLLLKDSLQALFCLIKNTGYLDFYEFDYSSSLKTKEIKKSIKFLDKNEYLHYFLTCRGTYPIWKKCMKKHEISFYDGDIFMGDDALLTLAFINHSCTFFKTNLALYFYRPNEKSGTKRLTPKCIDDISYFLLKTISFRKSKSEYEELVYNFTVSFTNNYAANPSFDFFSLKNVNKLFKIVRRFNFSSNIIFLKKSYILALKNRRNRFYLHFYMYRLVLRIFSVFGIKDRIKIKDYKYERS